MGGQAYPALEDPGARVAIDYGLYGVPETFVVDQRGVVARKFVGPVNPGELTTLLDSLMAVSPNTSATSGNDAPMLKTLPTTGKP